MLKEIDPCGHSQIQSVGNPHQY